MWCCGQYGLCQARGQLIKRNGIGLNFAFSSGLERRSQNFLSPRQAEDLWRKSSDRYNIIRAEHSQGGFSAAHC
jgi:hypothetical protein